MGLLDRFRKQWEQRGGRKSAPKKHVVSSEDAAKAAFRAVPASGARTKQDQPAGQTRAQSKRERRSDTGSAYRVLIRPLVTEKSTRLAVGRKYVFAVTRSANKVEVRRAVRSLYGVDPAAVNVMNVQGKRVRYGRTQGRTADWRKAVVTLKPGQKIDVQE